MKKRIAFLGALAAATLALVGCSDSGAPSAEKAPSAETPGASEMRDVRVAALPISDSIAVWVGIDEGIFEKHGLNVEIQPAQGGAQAIPALLSGDIQFAIGQPFGPFRAGLQDLGITVFSNFSSSQPSGDDVNGVVALGDSGITRPADLAGKKVAVNSLGAAGDLTIMAAVDADGGDAKSIEFVEVAFPDAAAQLEAGNIDAAWVPDPFQKQIAAEGTLVMHPYQQVLPGLTVLTNFTTNELIEKDPQLVKDYAAAMAEALEFTNEHDDVTRAAISEHLKIPAEVAVGLTLPNYDAKLDIDQIGELADLAVKYGVLDKRPDIDAIFTQY
ncbi:ABC-type nitrate/sulfonate/bicarbonate transport systems periplasmic components-like protein [Leucobacter sp. 7(1)]|uniref:ABC transporter substrate-binding protein n=1 Tax=Leucobacter sp. 7(1) TaxID=1255613 RepID=UPI00097ECFE6|nr:ABC transporter substrate-binding protein [Leucobacter sp. 7(1)]SJN11744.1 ABC-type nitrate/sulfonate/bicarbonate transport systems periplasmic components-like protein [Leucobacter sp. 7(1)]